MRHYIVCGPQGSGKGTQSRLLCADYDLVHISIGDIFRWHVAHHTKLAARIRRITDAGLLVPDEIVEEVVRKRLEEHDWNYGFVLDGFPRTLRQAEYLFENWNMDKVIYLDIPDEVVFERVMKRAKMGEGAGFTKRVDDNPEALKVRLQEYHEKTRPLLELYRRKGMLISVEATRSIEEIYLEIRQRLGLPEPVRSTPLKTAS
ncbi:MAG: nucleoside monophosphate kinase [Bryobacteraceae bacterium]|nr:nucleoside monophosphate kinase [Bryobacteraceae bacterium]MDW8376545.1 nucleoside monophosphate kinase [Bryobacterales bacterium]